MENSIKRVSDITYLSELIPSDRLSDVSHEGYPSLTAI